MILYVANRGEIARRVIRTAKRMKIKTAVGFANQDSEMPFVKEADASVCLDGEEASETYLNFEKVIAAAKKLNATHLHPGYGFLSENPSFVDALEKTGIEFVGPSSKAMRLLGDKIGSRKFLKKIDVPLLPSYDGDDQSDESLLKAAKDLGFPLLIKPSAGGGGKGMLRVDDEKNFLEALASSKRISKASFSDDRVFLEKLVTTARHIEVQVLADKKGNIQIVGERECSLQRRHQKVIEETPCIFLSDKLRNKIYDSSRKIAESANYHSLGTVEWIWDGADGIYFLEVNARLQVEHPVTEYCWNIDLVEWQLKVMMMNESVKDLRLQTSGHAMEARLCAEDPSQNFLPSGGKIHRLKLPNENLSRVDFGYYEKNTVPPQFDSMLGKIIVHGNDRADAISKLSAALEELVLFGPATNRAYLIQILKNKRVQAGEISTAMLQTLPYQFDIAKGLQLLKKVLIPPAKVVNSDSDDDDADIYSPWGAITNSEVSEDLFFEDFGEKRYFHSKDFDWTSARPRRAGVAASDSQINQENETSLRSPMPAKVTKLNVKAGDSVKKGDLLLVVEAMKMEHQMKAPKDLTISKVLVQVNERVPVDQVLVEWAKK
ncbi:MAG: biotin/lipoyl-binding protein [Deltaproteobacteria bacterium]|nr:biotin/lipoyl-binding protein [Deltaproteobacteria bacterium]